MVAYTEFLLILTWLSGLVQVNSQRSATATDIPIPVDDECHMKIQICGGSRRETNTMYFEINNHRVVTNDCDGRTWGSGPPELPIYYYFFAVTGSCRMITYFRAYIDAGFNEFNWIDNIYETLHMTPFGGYFVMISRRGFDQDIRVLSNWTRTHGTIMDDLGFLWKSSDYNTELMSVADYDYGDATERNDSYGDPALAAVYQKVMDGKRLLKTIRPEAGPRMIDVRIDNTDFCIMPLGPLDRVLHDTSIYGINDELEQQRPRELHLDLGNLIGCYGTVIGWEFIPANNEEDIWLIVGYRTQFTKLRQIARHKLEMQNAIITDDLEINYVCHREDPIRNVEPGHWYGYVTREDDGSFEMAPPFKMVYPVELVAGQFPCSRQFTWGEASRIVLYEEDIDEAFGFFESDVHSSYYGAIALRPIMDEDFMYHCGCSVHHDCQEFRDFNMLCNQGQCECRENYVYNRRQNRCLFADLPYNGTAVYQSSILEDEDMWKAEGAVDRNTEAHILNGTCAMTKEQIRPWFVIDLGMEVDVYGIEITTPIPLDVYLEAWETISNPPPDPVPDPDCFLHDDEYPDLSETSHCGETTLQRIDVHGPYPWKIESEDRSDNEILNRGYKDGLTVYYHTNPTGSNMGTVGINTQRVSRILYFGYMQHASDTFCWDDENDAIIKLDKLRSEDCTGSVIYVEVSLTDPNDHYFRRLSDSYTLKLDSFVIGANASFGSDSTSFLIYTIGGSLSGIPTLLDRAYIRPTNDVTKCLQFNGGSPALLQLSSTCDEFYLHEMFDETIPMYKYRQEKYNESKSGNPPYLEVDVESEEQGFPCYEIFTAKDQDVGTVNYVRSNTSIQIVAHDRYSNDDVDDSDPVIIRSNLVGVKDFNVSVGTFYYEGSFDVDMFDNYTLCKTFRGSPLNGKPFTLECPEPIRGRYVGIYLNTKRDYDKIQLCNVRVLTMKGKAYNSYCQSDTDCEWFRDEANGDQNLVCVKDDNEDKYGLCKCDLGYVYHTEAEMCVDIDECRDPLVDGDPTGAAKCVMTEEHKDFEGTINGTCVNLIGSYTCECPEGYRYNVTHMQEDYPTRGICVDINEAYELSCGCEGNCTNGVVSEDGYSFVCTCGDGFRLASDGLGCEDINECSVVPLFRGYMCNPERSTYIGDGTYRYLPYCLSKCAKRTDCLGVMHHLVTDECWLFTNCSLEIELSMDIYVRSFIEVFEDKYTCLYFYYEGLEKEVFSEDDTPLPESCINSVGSYKCICPEGYEYSSSNYSINNDKGFIRNLTSYRCTNINECPGRCEDGCTDMEPLVDDALYVCDCDNIDGYQLSHDNYSCIDTDECEEGINDCTSSEYPSADDYLMIPVLQRYKAWCRNTDGSYHCECPTGFFYHNEIESHWCEDIDECISPARIHECEDQCFNTNGSYVCDCDDGYTLSLNNHSCHDINECTTDTHNCTAEVDNFPMIIDGICHNEIGYFVCNCEPGYTWEVNGCYDINECMTTTPCQDHCENRYPADSDLMYECFCNDPGYRLSNDSRTCVDIDECDTGENLCELDSNATCVNTIGSYYCVCNHGYHWENDATLCLDVDECEEFNGQCTDICANYIGGYECTCFSGFELTENHHVCTDVEECEQHLDNCSDICHNTEGNYTCHCYRGRELTEDGNQCRDIDECQKDNGGCEHRCTNTRTEGPSLDPVTGVTCSCFQGYELLADYRGCVDIDECLQPDDNECAQICHNTVGSYTCSCHKGEKLTPDDRACLDVDECAEEQNGGCMMNCTNLVGSFYCGCHRGYTLDLNQKTCTDINECLDNNGDCQQICHNEPGSYQCACDGQNVLLKDGFNCLGFNLLELRSKLDLPYVDLYSDTSSREYKVLKEWLEYNFLNLCSDTQLNARGISRCQIEGPFFPTTEFQFESLEQFNTLLNPADRGGGTSMVGTRLGSRGQTSDRAPVRSHLENTIAERRETQAADRVQYEGFEGSIVGFDLVIRSEEILTEQKQAEISYIVSHLLKTNGNSVMINNSRVLLVDDPLFVNVREDGSENLFTVKSPCDYFGETRYCMNGATCEVLQDSPVCKCVDGYSGSRCDVKPSTVLRGKDIAVYCTLIGLGIICTFLTIGLCYTLLRKNEKLRIHREPQVNLGAPPSLAWRNSSGDYFK